MTADIDSNPPEVSRVQDTQRARAWLILGIAGVLAGLTAGLYGRTVWQDFQFLYYDDHDYVFKNPRVSSGLSAANLGWAFHPLTRVSSNWHPVTLVSHQLDCQVYGLQSWGHHLTNLLWHALNTVLLFAVLLRMTGAPWRSALAAALFAWHPLHVESVAWISERKDLLCAFFWFVGTWFYVGYARRPGFFRYALVGFCLFWGLLAKPMMVTFPCALMLLDYWPLNRYAAATSPRASSRRLGILFAEKLPLLFLSWLGASVTMEAQSSALVGLQRVSFGERLINAAISYDKYLLKMCWPADLATPYVLQANTLSWPQGVWAAIPLVAISLLAWRTRRRWPYVFAGWFWYVGTLTPVIGLVQVGFQSMADRYTYLPLIGIFVMLAWGLGDLTAWRPRLRTPAVVATVAALGLLWAQAFHQIGYWQNTFVLLRHTLDVTGDNLHARYGIASALRAEERYPETLAETEQILRLQPDFHEAYYLRGLALAAMGSHADCAREFALAVKHGAGKMPPKKSLALALAAARTYATHPDAAQRDVDQAIELAEYACRLANFQHPDALDALAAAYAEAGRYDEAVARATMAIQSAQHRRNLPLAERVQARRELYRQHKPFRHDPSDPVF